MIEQAECGVPECVDTGAIIDDIHVVAAPALVREVQNGSREA